MMRIRWGIFGTGSISSKFVAALSRVDGAHVEWVASRTIDSASRFASAHGIPRFIAPYVEAARNASVDVVYIATPPSEHFRHALMCIEAGLSVLIEKPMATCARDAQAIAEAAAKRSVFAMEGLWTRFLPASQEFKAKVMDGDVGGIRLIRGSFGSSQRPDPRNNLYSRALGGGALTHLGSYPLSWGQWLFGQPVRISADGNFGESEVVEDALITLRYPGNVLGSFAVSLRSWAPDDLHVMGTDGMLSLKGTIVRPHGWIWHHEAPLGPQAGAGAIGRAARLRQNHWLHQLAQRVNRNGRAPASQASRFYSGNGYEHEVLEVHACMKRGATESSVMSLNESIAIASTSDAVLDCMYKQLKRES
ncbi:4-carboxy-2-hydroxymuconate-6-semialdehyde dehydrogenase [Xylophilus ampelinus]|nr:Gfo/Idh/MocA family oxidoreductase [Variovorax sp.]VTY36716.1 4-carboxy-2-hydroxymuconate-6-semialdehyde dehydrogenase [Xylophilus ampelinus]